MSHITIGFSMPIIANHLAQAVTKNQLKSQTDPKKMLGVFYKSQTLKLAFFTMTCLLVMLAATKHSTEIVIGVISNTVYKRVTNSRKAHEPHQSYSN